MSSRARGPANPFPGLRAFRTEEHHLFFGREEQVAALLKLLREHRLLSVVGTSGSGKSSLVRAGLVPALHRGTMAAVGSSWEVVILRPGGDPITNLARALIAADLYDPDDRESLPRLHATLTRSRNGLIEAVKQSADIDSGTSLLVVVDQFEELFRFRQRGVESEEAASEFVNLLLAATEQEGRNIYTVITMRSDYLGDCSEIPGLAEAVNRGKYLVPRLLRDQKAQAIEMPVGVGEARITPRLVQRILNAVGDDTDQLPVLQHALMRTWDAWVADHEPDEPIDFRHYDATGGMEEALSRHADEVYLSLPDQTHREACERLFKVLTERGADNRGIRRPMRLQRLRSVVGVDQKTLCTILNAFRRPGVTFLMPGVDRELRERTVVDLSHESLMRVWVRLRSWVEEEAQSARIYRRLVETALLWEVGKAGLFRDPDLSIATSWRERARPNKYWADLYGGDFELAMGFLDRSQEAVEAERLEKERARQHELEQAQALARAESSRAEEQQRAARRLRVLAAGVALVAVAAVVAFIMARQARHEADRNAQLAADRAEDARASAELASLKEKEATEAAAQLEDILVRSDFNQGARQIEDGNASEGLAYISRALHRDREFWPAGMRAMSTLASGRFRMRQFPAITQENPISDYWLSPLGDLVLTSDVDLVEAPDIPRRFVWDLRTGERLYEVMPGEKLAFPTWSEDGQRLYSYSIDSKKILAWDARSGTEVWSLLPREPLEEIGFRLGDHPELGPLVLLRYDEAESIQSFSATTGKPVTEEIAHPDAPVIQYGYSPGADFFWSWLSNGVLLVYETATARAVAEIAGGSWSSQVYFTPDGSTLLAVARDGRSVGWWPISKEDSQGGGEPAGSSEPDRDGWVEFPTPVEASLLPSGRKVAVFASGSRQSRLHIDVYDLSTREKTASFDPAPETADGAPGRYTAWRYLQQDSPWGHVLRFPLVAVIERARQNSVVLWDLESGAEFRRIPSPWFLTNLEFAPDARRIATVSVGHDVMIWDVFEGTPLLQEPIEYEDPVRLSFSPDGGLLMSSVWPPDTVQFLDSRTGKQLLEPLPGFFSRAPIFVAGGDRAALFQSVRTTSAGVTKLTEGRFLVVDIAQRPIIFETLVGAGGGITAIARFTPDGSRVVVSSRESAADPMQALIFDARTRRLERSVTLPSAVYCYHLEVSPDSRVAVLGCTDQRLRVLNVQSGKFLHELVMDGALSALAISSDGRRVAAGTVQGKVRVFDLTTGAPLGHTLNHGERQIRDLTFSPDAALVVSASQDYSFRFVDAVTGNAAREPVKRDNVGVDSLFLGEGSHLALVTFEESASILDLKSGRVERELRGRVPQLAAAVSPDGSILALGGGTHSDYPDGEVVLWNWQTGRRLGHPLAHKGQVGTLAFSHDGSLLVSGTNGLQGAVQVWDVESGRALTDPISGRGGVRDAVFNAADTEVVASWPDGLVRILDLPPRVTPKPLWLETLVEVVGGRRLPPDKQATEDIPDDERTRLLEEVVATIHSDAAAPDGDDVYSRWARWFLADPAERTISPGASVRLEDYLSELRSSSRLENLLEALRISPGDGVTHARIGLALHDSVPGEDDANEQERRHWHDTALWYLDRAIELEPEDPQVWLLRAELLDKLGRRNEAREALARSERLETTVSANVAFRRATTLARDGMWAEADAAFEEAIGALLDTEEGGGSSGSGVPLLGVLQQLEPSPAALDFRDFRLPEPIPGTFEDFDDVPAGAVPDGWTTAANGWRPSVAQPDRRSQRHLRSEAVPDWFAIDADRNPGWNILNRGHPGRLRGRVPTTLLDGRFLAAVPRREGCDRPQRSVETRDLDLTGRQDVHVAFHSSRQQAPNSLAGVEYSTDGGTTWHPVVYWIDAREITYDPSGAVDAVATLTEVRREVPWYIDLEGAIRGANYADYLMARIGPELAAHIEGRRAGHVTDSRRIEVRRLPLADGQKTVRLRFFQVSAATVGTLWGVDRFGLYEIPDECAIGPLEQVDSTSDPTVLAGLGLDSLLGRVGSSAVRSALSPPDLYGLSVAEPEFGEAQWIWRARESAAGEVVAFRRAFRIEAPAQNAHILAACDDSMEIFINGERVLRGQDAAQASARSVTTVLKTGDNVLAVRGENRTLGGAGLLVRLEIQSEGGKGLQLVSDGTWLVSHQPEEGWQQTEFDASHWAPAHVLGPYGIAPWRRRYDSSDATEEMRGAAALLLRRAARLAPGDPWILLASAYVKARVGLLDEGFADLRRSLELRPLGHHSARVLAALWVLRGDELKTAGKTGQAAVAYELADLMLRILSSEPDTDLLPRLASVGLATDARILLPRGSTWKYLDRGAFPEEGWVDPGYEDSAWRAGPARLGYGESPGVEKTRIDPSDPQARRTSVHFRTAFEIADPETVRQLKLRLLRDDGAVIYLNGQEIARDNMPGGTVLPTTWARQYTGGAAEMSFQEIDVLSPPLRKGRNVLAVSVHQANSSSSDLGFDLELEAVSGLSNHVQEFAKLESAEQSIGLEPFLRAALWLDRGRRLRSVGQLDRAETALEIARGLATEPAGVLYESALLQWARGNEEPAYRGLVDSFQAAVRIKRGPSLSSALLLPEFLRETVEPLWDVDPFNLAWIARTLEDSSPPNWEVKSRWALRRALELASSHEERFAVARAWAGRESSRGLELIDAELARSLPQTPSAREVREYRDWLRLREEVLGDLGRAEEADQALRDLAEPLPRPEGLDPKLLDLSGHYTSGLYGGWVNRGSDHYLRLLPETYLPEAGIRFDLRGIVQLNSGLLEGDEVPDSERGKDVNQIRAQNFPDSASGIRVDQQVKALHFLGGCIYARPPVGEAHARIVVHYADASLAEIPIRFGEDFTDWANLREELDLDRVAWRIRDDDQVRFLMRKTWENPSPQKVVSHLDFVSARRNGAPFLVAVTVE